MKTVIRWQYLAALAALSAGLALSLISPTWLVTNFINPMALLLWAVVRVFLSVHQTVYWAGLIFLAFFLALRILPQRPVVYKHYPTGEEEQISRVAHWYNLIRSAPTDAGKEQALKTELLALIDEWQQTAGEQWSKKSANGHLGTDPYGSFQGSIPRSVAAFLTSDSETGNKQPWYRKNWITRSTARWMPWRTKRVSEYESAIEHLVGFLEKKMERNIDEQSGNSDDC